MKYINRETGEIVDIIAYWTPKTPVRREVRLGRRRRFASSSMWSRLLNELAPIAVAMIVAVAIILVAK